MLINPVLCAYLLYFKDNLPHRYSKSSQLKASCCLSILVSGKKHVLKGHNLFCPSEKRCFQRLNRHYLHCLLVEVTVITYDLKRRTGVQFQVIDNRVVGLGLEIGPEVEIGLVMKYL